ncbi:hypothetical protein [Chitinophaga rhizosphaerae]|uniref:hypothetical protein n=1 Tax=Chitinophaga rhizosphaerae TaxID=1864947 RepID=UPI000F7FDA51|nr:hypothetical protein [Chitinophaga rhizosphaerae]
MTDKFIFWLAAMVAAITGLLFTLENGWLASLGVDFPVLVAGNIVLALIALVSYSLCRKGLAAENPNVFVRSVYASTLSKLMLCVAGIGVYVFVTRDHVSKATIFILLFFYLVYTVLETWQLFRASLRQKKHQ